MITATEASRLLTGLARRRPPPKGRTEERVCTASKLWKAKILGIPVVVRALGAIADRLIDS